MYACLKFMIATCRLFQDRFHYFYQPSLASLLHWYFLAVQYFTCAAVAAVIVEEMCNVMMHIPIRCQPCVSPVFRCWQQLSSLCKYILFMYDVELQFFSMLVTITNPSYSICTQVWYTVQFIYPRYLTEDLLKQPPGICFINNPRCTFRTKV